MPSFQRSPLTYLFWLTGNPKATYSQHFLDYFTSAFSCLAPSGSSPFFQIFIHNPHRSKKPILRGSIISWKAWGIL